MAHEIDYSVFVGDLAPEVDDQMLEQTFRTYYPSTKQAKVMVDPASGRSRGFGFVRFTNEPERDRAMNEMNGVYIGSKQIRVSLATRKPAGASAPGGSPQTGVPVGSAGVGTASSTGGASSNVSTATATAAGSHAAGGRDSGDPAANPNNTTLFIGGLSSTVSEAELHAAFSRCGEIVYTKIPPGKGCGFVQFVTRGAAEYALEHMNGFVLGGMPIRISWGKSSRPPGGGPFHPSSHPPGGPMHPGYAAGYGAYGAYDPYAGGYGAYGVPYDPYGAYPGYAMDPYAAYHGYGHPAAGPAGVAAAAAANAAAATHGGPAPGTPGAIQPVLYDPLTPVNVEKMNMAYMHRQVPVFTGAYVRMPVAAMPIQQHQHM